MTIAIELPKLLHQRLAAYCRAHELTEDQAIEQALLQLLNETEEPTAYDLGADGFGSDQTNCGDIARNSKRILRERFRDPSAG